MNYRDEAMKEAHFLANFRECVNEDYPSDYHSGWREIPLEPTGLII